MPKPNASDAQLILQLYNLRREPVMRAARKFMSQSSGRRITMNLNPW